MNGKRKVTNLLLITVLALLITGIVLVVKNALWGIVLIVIAVVMAFIPY
jgi:hypothetical protein